MNWQVGCVPKDGNAIARKAAPAFPLLLRRPARLSTERVITWRRTSLKQVHKNVENLRSSIIPILPLQQRSLVKRVSPQLAN